MISFEQVKAKMDSIITKKAEDWAEIERLTAAATTALAAAKAELEAAAAAMDSRRYAAAEKAQADAELQLSMIETKKRQLAGQEYIPEPESDEYIDAILAHEKKLSDSFEKDAGELLQQLDSLHSAYAKQIAAAEAVLTKWTTEVHANFRTFGHTQRFDAAGGAWTDRSDRPVPVRGNTFMPMKYTGSDAARAIRNALDNGLHKIYRP